MATEKTQVAMPERVIIRSWPKMIFLWPTMITSLFMGIATSINADLNDLWGAIFMTIFGLNLLVLTFEFPRGAWLTAIIAIVAVVATLLLLNQRFNFLPTLRDWLAQLTIHASPAFFYTFFTIQVVLFIGMYVVTRFDYWELTPNELIHHHGLLSDVERLSTAGLKLNKEIADVFEYILANAGTIVAVVPGNNRPIVLENVLNISKVERNAGLILDARMVRVEKDAVPGQAAQHSHQHVGDDVVQ